MTTTYRITTDTRTYCTPSSEIAQAESERGSRVTARCHR